MNHLKTTLPRLVLAAMALVLVLGAIPAQAAKPNLTPAISLGPLSHRENLSVNITAKAKLAQIRLRIDNKRVQPWVKGHAGWKYSIKYPLNKLTVGIHTAKLKVWDQKNRSTQRQWQFQKLAQLALSADRSSAQPGEKVSLTGWGFTPGTAITVGMGGQNTGVGGNYGSATADRSGSFTLEATLDRYPDDSPLHAGTITLLAHNSDGSEKAGVELRVLPAPRLALDKSSIKPGDEVRVTGDGFTPGVAVSISLSGVNAGAGGNYGSAATDSTGSFTLNVNLPQLPDGSPLFAGPVVLVAHTADSQEKATAQFQILADPSISLDKTAIKAGEKVTVNGKSFTPGASVSMALGDVNTEASGNYGSAVVDGSGRFSLAMTLERYPNGSPLPAGPIVLVAHDGAWTQTASTQLQVLTLSASPMSVLPGESITLTGQGFRPGSTINLSMALSGAAPAGNYGTGPVDATGHFVLTARLTQCPSGSPLQPGPVVLVASDPATGQSAAVQIQVAEHSRAAPSDLRIVSITKGTTSAEPTVVGLRWWDNSSNEGGFRIQGTYTRMNGGSDTQVWSVAANATTAQVSFMAGGINPVSKVCFTVTAFNGQGNSPPSNAVCALL